MKLPGRAWPPRGSLSSPRVAPSALFSSSTLCLYPWPGWGTREPAVSPSNPHCCRQRHTFNSLQAWSRVYVTCVNCEGIVCAVKGGRRSLHSVPEFGKAVLQGCFVRLHEDHTVWKSPTGPQGPLHCRLMESLRLEKVSEVKSSRLTPADMTPMEFRSPDTGQSSTTGQKRQPLCSHGIKILP